MRRLAKLIGPCPRFRLTETATFAMGFASNVVRARCTTKSSMFPSTSLVQLCSCWKYLNAKVKGDGINNILTRVKSMDGIINFETSENNGVKVRIECPG